MTRQASLGNNTPRILYVITDLNVGGVPLHLRRLALAMGKRGYRPQVVSLAVPGPVADMLVGDGIEVLSCQGLGGWDFRVISKLAKVIRKHRPDLIHSLLFHANLAARWAAHKADFPAERVICEIQTVEVERKWHLGVDRYTYEACRFTIGNSPSVIEHLVTRGGIPRDRLRLVRGGIDPSPLLETPPIDPTELGLGSDDRIVLWVGRLDPVKGLDHLIDAFGPVAANEGAFLLLVGTGPLQRQLARQVQRRRLARHVHLLGARDDIPALLKAASVFAFPSRTEGLPNALLEAMVAGCPIVATDVPGCRDLIKHDETGLLVPYGEVGALSDAISRLLTDRPLAARLAQQASEVARRDWHIQRSLGAYEAIYREALAST